MTAPWWLLAVIVLFAVLVGFLLGHERRVYRRYRDVDLVGAQSSAEVEEWRWPDPPGGRHLRTAGDEPRNAA